MTTNEAHETFAYMPHWLAERLCLWPSRATHLMVLHQT